MRILSLIKGFCGILLCGALLMGSLFFIGNTMLKGEGHGTFFGYQVTDNYVNNDDGLYHVGNAIVIKEVPETELHHDTAIACYDKENKQVYVYRIVGSIGKQYKVVDPSGTIIYVASKDVIGKVIEI